MEGDRRASKISDKEGNCKPHTFTSQQDMFILMFAVHLRSGVLYLPVDSVKVQGGCTVL
jgi:hypothetical protein